MNPMFDLSAKIAAVIGGGGVLAGEMAMGLARAGADVAVLDLKPEAAEARAEEIRKLGRRALALSLDATKKSEIQAACDKVVAGLGGVNILLNAAGINSSTPFLEITEAEWQTIMDVDLKSVFLASQIFGKAMIDAGKGGSIINISSASSGPPLSKVFTYSVAKGGVNQVTQFLAREWAPQGIRVNAILPGFFPAGQNRKILTPERVESIMGHTPMNRYGEAAELNGAVVFLASEAASSFVTGAIIRVDGGFSAMTI